MVDFLDTREMLATFNKSKKLFYARQNKLIGYAKQAAYIRVALSLPNVICYNDTTGCEEHVADFLEICVTKDISNIIKKKPRNRVLCIEDIVTPSILDDVLRERICDTWGVTQEELVDEISDIRFDSMDLVEIQLLTFHGYILSRHNSFSNINLTTVNNVDELYLLEEDHHDNTV